MVEVNTGGEAHQQGRVLKEGASLRNRLESPGVFYIPPTTLPNTQLSTMLYLLKNNKRKSLSTLNNFAGRVDDDIHPSLSPATQ